MAPLLGRPLLLLPAAAALAVLNYTCHQQAAPDHYGRVAYAFLCLLFQDVPLLNNRHHMACFPPPYHWMLCVLML